MQFFWYFAHNATNFDFFYQKSLNENKTKQKLTIEYICLHILAAQKDCNSPKY